MTATFERTNPNGRSFFAVLNRFSTNTTSHASTTTPNHELLDTALTSSLSLDGLQREHAIRGVSLGPYPSTIPRFGPVPAAMRPVETTVAPKVDTLAQVLGPVLANQHHAVVIKNVFKQRQ